MEMKKYVAKLTGLTLLTLGITQSVQAVIVVPAGEIFNLDYYENDTFQLFGTLNILSGGSAELAAFGTSSASYLNIQGGDLRAPINNTSSLPTINMSSGYFAGTNGVETPCNITISGGTVGAAGLDNSCQTTVTGGTVEGVVRTLWGGDAFLYGGVFEDSLISTGGGDFHIYGGEYLTQEIYHTNLDWLNVDFYGYDLSMTEPELITHYGTYRSSYNTQVTGYLSDGNYIDMDVTYNVAFSNTTGGVTLHNTAVPIPAALWLFGSGLFGLIGVARRKKA